MHIIPDRRVENKDVEDLLRTLAGMYTPPYARWNGKGFNAPQRTSWEIVMGPKSAEFYLTVSSLWESVIKKQLAVIWPHATVVTAEDPLLNLSPIKIGKLELKQHYLFPLKVDRRTLGILPSLLECTRMLTDNQTVAVQLLMDPASPDWWQGASTAYESYRAGRMPKRWGFSPGEIVNYSARALTYVMAEAASIMTEFMVGESQPETNLDSVDRAQVLRERPIGHNVADKLKGDAVDLTIRIAVQVESQFEAAQIMRSIWYAFRVLDGDNSFALVPEKNEKAWLKMLDREPGFKINRDYISTREASMLVQLPTGPLQQEYKLTAVDYRETKLPAIVLKDGLYLGDVTDHGKSMKVYQPIKNYDELCQPRCVIGGMGTGKTKGYGANLAVESVRKGMGAVVIDPAKGELGDEICSVLKPDQYIRIRFGRQPISLDWREVLHSKHGRNRLANELVAFTESATDEAGAQTIRYLRAAAKAVPGGRLNEIVDLMTFGDYRKALIPLMREQEAEIWEAFDKLSDARQAQIAAPVLSRLDVILGDDYLSSCMEASEGIDFVDLLEKPRVVIIDIPKGELGAEAVDILASMISTKLDLAMVLRKSEHPVFIIQDEPHQYVRSARIWRSAAVESRKWRFAYCWMFHAWEQIPRDVAAIIQAAVPHYTIYTSSKATYRALTEEIRPFDIEEAMATPRHWAINVLRAGGVTVSPFLAKMAMPPSLAS